MSKNYSQIPLEDWPPEAKLRAAVAKVHVANYLRKKDAYADGLPDYRIPDPPKGQEGLGGLAPYDKPVCIVGAGAAGLYIAMMLKYLNITNVDILEASDRVGGRCATYRFQDDSTCEHNYYDMGAMRIPNIPSMATTINLINNHKLLNIPQKLVSYVYKTGNEPQCYWYSTQSKPKGEPFENAIKAVLTSFQTDFKAYMEDGNDLYSTRSWLTTKGKLTYDETVEGELSDTSTGLFDQALTETLCDYTDFQLATDKEWYRVEQGMSVVTDTMRERVESSNWPRPESVPIKVTRNRPVVAMALTEGESAIKVTSSEQIGGPESTKDYDMVFSTVPMPPLQRMDLEGLKLDKKILNGIRALSYDRATKVAIKFKTRWWSGLYEGKTPWGGVSSSDLPIGNVVYPSWNDGDDSPNVLIVSYTWAQDATRMAALVPDYTKVAPQKTEPIVKLCLQDLVKLWAGQPGAPTFESLWDSYISHHAWAWSHDPFSGGAFALFGPGQFSGMYPPFQRVLCEKKLAICGEALSVNHAWISGALDSAYGAVMRWLIARNMDRRAKMLELSPFGLGAGKHTVEFDEQLAYAVAQLKDEDTW